VSLGLIVAALASAAAQDAPPGLEGPPILVPSRYPRGARSIDAGSWIGTSDYPVQARRRGAEGAVRVRYTVNRTGRVEGCEIVESSGVEALDRASCALLTARGRFEPARDAGGEAVASVVQQRIVWKLPEQVDPVPYRPGRIVVVTPVERDGVPACDIRSSEPALEPFGLDLCGEVFPEEGASKEEGVTAIATLSDGNAPPSPPLSLAAPLIASGEARFTIETDGRVTGCTTADGGGDLSLFFCDYFETLPGEAAYFEPVATRRAVRATLRVHRGRIPVRP
jgi:TonB family protein